MFGMMLGGRGRGIRTNLDRSGYLPCNVEKSEMVALKKLAAELLAYDDNELARVVIWECWSVKAS